MTIRITRVYTRSGDAGYTGLVGGRRVLKDSLRIEGYGTIDELNATLGVAREFNREAIRKHSARGAKGKACRRLEEILRRLQNELFDLGSELATAPGDSWPGMWRVSGAETKALERLMDECQKELKPLESFVLPGGGMVAAHLHVARTVCRRAERLLVRLMNEERMGAEPLRYLNRLSDLFFVLSRWIAHRLGEEEVLWKQAKRRGSAAENVKRKTQS